jgi:hypothetical protein
MADKKISQLTLASTPLSGNETLPVVQTGATVQVSVSNLTADRAVSATSVATGLGATGTPAYTFTGDLNTGMWSPAADTIAFSEGGVEAMRLDSSGNLLVGVTSTLDFASTTTTGTQIRGPGIRASSTARALDLQRTVTDGSVAFFYRDTANVGSISVSTTATSYNTSSSSGITGVDANAVAIRTNTAERLRVTSMGNVGINETAPDYRLDVNGAIGFTPGASVTPVDNGDVVFELTNNTTLTVKAKGSDGVVRSATLTLA